MFETKNILLLQHSFKYVKYAYFFLKLFNLGINEVRSYTLYSSMKKGLCPDLNK